MFPVFECLPDALFQTFVVRFGSLRFKTFGLFCIVLNATFRGSKTFAFDTLLICNCTHMLLCDNVMCLVLLVV